MKKGCFIRFIYLVPVVLIISAGCTKIGREEKDNFAFSHKFHIEQGVQCLNCHEGIQTSESSGFELPTEDTCAQCHNETQESPGCEKCHTNPAAAEKFLPKKTNLIFSHKNHIPRVKNDCTACHISVSSSRSIKDNLLPPMDSCVNCHSDSVKNLKCSQCHTDLGSYDLKPITHLSHKGNFLKEHQDFARADVSVCSQCHRESFCSDCHSRTEG
ncbi:MAG TPA: cytochrome c3 family protein, partial [bacterium]